MIDRIGTLLATLVWLSTSAPQALATAPPVARRGAESPDEAVPAPVSLSLFREVVFYDMYAPTVAEPFDPELVRHSNTLYATRLGGGALDSIQNTLTAHVFLGALCDNYDRLAGVFLSMVPKGAKTYVPGEVERIEIARFITPFMDCNRSVEPVPYEFDLDHLVPVLKDPALSAKHDLWIEFNVEGVPYAANKEIAGCEGRKDVFWGILELSSDSSAPAEEFDVLIPLATRAAFNNYKEGASDEVGTTRKTLRFELQQETAQTQLVLITSNHGANAGGEEYNRRDHFVFVDGEKVHAYKPGRESCEPFRAYNTQNNGIYGHSPKSDAEWQSFSNWCPGDVIDTRIIELGPLEAGGHEVVIDVPDAEFVGGQGDIPLSLFVQGRSASR